MLNQSRNEKTLTLIVLVITACVLPILAGCGENTERGDSRSADTSATETALPSDSLVIVLTGADSMTVFDLLQENHKVDFVASAAGVFVKAIDSIENSSDYFWLYSVNDSMGQVACDRHLTKTSDTVKWHYQRFGK